MEYLNENTKAFKRNLKLVETNVLVEFTEKKLCFGKLKYILL